MFLSVDPVTAYGTQIGQFHRYRYANNNPYSLTDPDGRQAVDSDRQKSEKVTGSNLSKSEVAQAMISNDGMSASASTGYGSSSSSQQGSQSAQTADGRIPVPGVVGWKTGQYDMSRTPEQVDSAGMVITGAAVVAIGAISVESGGPYVVAASSGLWSGARSTWRNLSFDGPSAGGMHGNGRLLGVRWRGGQWGMRLDLHPINSGSTPILHINYGPVGRGEAAHLVLFDPRWLRRGGE